ncbi:MAG: metal-dependent transcriptional regulator [Candidatus Bathyarchaeia archaeon]
MKISPAIEEFLEAIYKLQKDEGCAKTTQLAKLLNVALGTVTNTVEKLERLNLIVHIAYKGVKLTKKGEALALSIIRRHRLSERLLADFLCVEWDEVHEKACLIEHGISDEVASLIEKKLNYPKTCPHGNPIPTQDGHIEEEKELILLTKLKPQEKFTIIKITEEKSELLKYLKKHNLTPGSAAEVVSLHPLNDSILINVNDESCCLTQQAASRIWVKKL